jgi:hypothetical protein
VVRESLAKQETRSKVHGNCEEPERDPQLITREPVKPGGEYPIYYLLLTAWLAQNASKVVRFSIPTSICCDGLV